MIHQVEEIRTAPSRVGTKGDRITRQVISVVIPALNEQKHIERCLASLAALPNADGSLEVIVVDNGSTDRTIELAEAFKPTLNLTVVKRRGVRISALRNYGALQSSGEILVFLDADCVAKPHWFGDHNVLRDKLARVGILGAQYEIPSESSWVARAWERAQNRGDGGDVRYIPGGGMLMRREVFNSVGGFDEALETNEDAELCGRVRKSGHRVVADQSMAVLHLGTSQSLMHFYRRQRWHGSHVFRVFLRSPGRSGNEKAVLLALYTLLLEAAIVASFVVGITQGKWSLLALSVWLWLVPPIGLAVKSGLTHSNWKTVPQLIALYATYATARAHCLLSSGRRKRQ